ncbi:hypothetical protein JFN49_001747 [Campylobacter coli]|nr:hypothetical protein [Campylobacter coli]EJJ1698542.1 hypothetical protein [Campylobacter jejuni]EGS0645047.1 hypothetical protein [Campylobacter coli]EGS1146858.1 hypothetical protein [Campylobacter coli]EGU0561919.1 hypothetical protein [Campylobacter coli]
MLHYFRFKKDGNCTKILLRKKKTIFDKPKETYISKKSDILITGINASGKSKRLNSFLQNAKDLWKKEHIIFFHATDSLSEIFHRNLDNDDETKRLIYGNENANLNLENLDTSKNYLKIIALVEKSKNSTLIIDDLDKLNGKKLEMAKELLRNCKRFIATAKDEISINKTIGGILKSRRKKLEIVSLSSKASIDATNALLVLFVLALFATGLYELALLVTAGRIAMRGMQK